jgi:hypothetical protein
LIENGGFERQPAFTGWGLSGYLLPQLRSPGYAGSYQAALGANFSEQPGLNGANSTLTQTITLPALSPQLSLRFTYLLSTSQPAPVDPGNPYSYDKFEVFLVDGTGARHDLLVDWSGKFWWTHGALDLTPFAGQRVTIGFNVWQSAATANYPTIVYLDEVRLWPFASLLPNARKNSAG